MYTNYINLFWSLSSFLVLCLASNQCGKYIKRIKLPVITGYLLMGLIVGPSILQFISYVDIERLEFIDEIALSFIAFTAGSELVWKDIKPRLQVIKWISFGVLLTTFSLCTYIVYLLGDYIPFMKDMNHSSRIAVAILAGSILVARSPSSAIAVVNELKAKGQFTQVALGVTVIVDIFVICLFTVCESFSNTLLTDNTIDIIFIIKLIMELMSSFLIGFGLAKIIDFGIKLNFSDSLKPIVIVLIGYSCYYFSHVIDEQFSFHLEPMLICLSCGFFISNFTEGKRNFTKALHQFSPLIYIAFFTLTGASLKINIFLHLWYVTVILFFVRLTAIMIGSYLGGTYAKGEPQHNRIRWMCFITQAGVGLGLAKQVSDSYPSLGNEFATLLVSVIVINEIIGPIFFKWSLNLAGEAKTNAKKSEKNTIPNAVIFGESPDASALARQLCAHNWYVKVLKFRDFELNFESEILENIEIKFFDETFIENLETHDSDTFIIMLSDDENLNVANIIKKKHPDSHLLIALRERSSLTNFDGIDASFVDPSTAIVSLLDHYVRTPSTVSLLFDYDNDHDIIDIEVSNPRILGLKISELDLPSDVLVLSITRKGKVLEYQRAVKLERQDKLTLIGEKDSLEKSDLILKNV